MLGSNGNMVSMGAPTGLAGRGLSKAYGSHCVFDGIDVELEYGTLTAVVGPNGSGKSTLLRCLAGVERLDAGEIALDGDPCDPTSADHWGSVLCILDDHEWLPELSVRDHLVLVGAIQDVDEALATLHLHDLGDRLPASLSSGQRQRAAIGLALVRPWRVLLLDEPERHLDHDGVMLLGELLREMAGPDRTIAFATHAHDLVGRAGATTFSIT